MKGYLTERNYTIAATIGTLALSGLTKYIIKKSYKRTTGYEPPQNPVSTEANLKEVMIFSFTTALATTAVKLIGRKLLAQTWRKSDGDLPHHLK